jgi:hypothetical protein
MTKSRVDLLETVGVDHQKRQWWCRRLAWLMKRLEISSSERRLYISVSGSVND